MVACYKPFIQSSMRVILIASGTPSSVAENPQVIEAYLGHGAAEAMAEGG